MGGAPERGMAQSRTSPTDPEAGADQGPRGPVRRRGRRGGTRGPDSPVRSGAADDPVGLDARGDARAARGRRVREDAVADRERLGPVRVAPRQHPQPAERLEAVVRVEQVPVGLERGDRRRRPPWRPRRARRRLARGAASTATARNPCSAHTDNAASSRGRAASPWPSRTSSDASATRLAATPDGIADLAPDRERGLVRRARASRGRRGPRRRRRAVRARTTRRAAARSPRTRRGTTRATPAPPPRPPSGGAGGRG